MDRGDVAGWITRADQPASCCGSVRAKPVEALVSPGLALRQAQGERFRCVAEKRCSGNRTKRRSTAALLARPMNTPLSRGMCSGSPFHAASQVGRKSEAPSDVCIFQIIPSVGSARLSVGRRFAFPTYDPFVYQTELLSTSPNASCHRPPANLSATTATERRKACSGRTA